MRRTLPILTLVVALAASTSEVAVAEGCAGKSNTNWLRHYADACTPLRVAAKDCSLCHITVDDLNPYGDDLADVGNLPWLVEDLDSDGDGRTNGDEIVDCTR
ncbi:hypothetical protein GF314_13790, partial [bacterium]|nr:hypothetical protein [bacterium]